MDFNYRHFTSLWIEAIEQGTTVHVEKLSNQLRLLPAQFAPLQPPAEMFGDEVGHEMRDPGPPIQVRYLLFHSECRYVELIRISAIHAAERRLWVEAAQFWSQAYDHLHRVQIEADPFYTIYISFNESLELPDQHSFAQLQQLFEKLDLVKGHTEAQRDRAIGIMERRLENIDRQLNPLRQDRDQVRGSLGEDRWNNNPNARHDYARRRAPFEEERRALVQALEIIGNLSLSSAAGEQPQ